MQIVAIIFFLTFLLPLVGYACSDEERAEMLKAGISPEYIEKSCRIDGLDEKSVKDKDDKRESEIPEEISAATDTKSEALNVDDDHLYSSNMSNQISVMPGRTRGKLESSNGDSLDLNGDSVQFVYFHIFPNEIIAGIRHV